MAARLQGKVAMITGAASGIGRATATRFVEEGARVAVADLDEERGAAFAEQLGENAMFVRCDHTVRAEDDAAVQAVLDRWGQLDVLHNNAALNWSGEPEDVGDEELERMVAVNVLGPWRMSMAALPALRESAKRNPEEGSLLLFTGSVIGIRAIAGNAPYTATKHAVMGMMRALALDFGPENIRVNAVCPGLIDTPGMRRESVRWGDPGESLEKFRLETPLRRLAKDVDIANAAVFLASPEARTITSLSFVVDGGHLPH